MNRTRFIRFAIRSSLAAFAAANMVACAGPAAKPDAYTSVPEHCPTGDALLAAADSEFGQQLIRRMTQQVFYPELAQEAGQTGQVDTCVEVQRNGTVRKALVQHSSGFPLLDGAAIYSAGMVNIMSPLDHVPGELGGPAQSVWLAVPVNFRLSGAGADSHASSADNLEMTAGEREQFSRFWSSAEGRQYGDALRGAIADALIYPPGANRLRDEERTVVRFVINREGLIQSVSIARSAGDPQFDGVVLMSFGFLELKKEKHPLPDSLPGDSFVVELPISFESHRSLVQRKGAQ